MHGILNPEGPVMSFITKITYSAYLNLLWLVCCLPIVTAGASTTALFYVTLKVAKNEEGSLTKSFFHSFRENFRQATVIWLILLAVGIVLGVDGYIFYHMRFENAFWTVATAVFLVAAAAYAIILMYIFPLLARFDNTTAAMFKNAIMLGSHGRHILCHGICHHQRLYADDCLRGGTLRTAVLLPALQHPAALPGKTGRTRLKQRTHWDRRTCRNH